MTYHEKQEARKKGLRGAFAKREEGVEHIHLITIVKEMVERDGFRTTPVDEKEADCVIRSFCSDPIRGLEEVMCYLGARVYIKDETTGNFTSDDGMGNEEIWCRDLHEVYINHPSSGEPIRLSAKFEDGFYKIEGR